MSALLPPNVQDRELSAWMMKWIDPQHGLIRDITLIPKIPGSPNIYRVTATSGDQHVARGVLHFKSGSGRKSGYGAAPNLTRACWASIGEAIERYSAGVYRDEGLVVGSSRELGASTNPVDRMIFREEAFGPPARRYAQYDATVTRRWAKAQRVLGRERVLLPTQMVWFGYESRFEGESIGLISSNGVAEGRSRDRAIVAGILEVVERDSLMCHWYAGSRPKAILKADFWGGIDGQLFTFVTERGLDVTAIHLANEFGIPVVFTLICDERHGVIGTGCSASFSASAACAKSIYEAIGIYLHQLERAHAGAKPASPDSVGSFADHVSAYRNRELVGESWSVPLRRGIIRIVGTGFTHRAVD